MRHFSDITAELMVLGDLNSTDELSFMAISSGVLFPRVVEIPTFAIVSALAY